MLSISEADIWIYRFAAGLDIPKCSATVVTFFFSRLSQNCLTSSISCRFFYGFLTGLYTVFWKGSDSYWCPYWWEDARMVFQRWWARAPVRWLHSFLTGLWDCEERVPDLPVQLSVLRGEHFYFRNIHCIVKREDVGGVIPPADVRTDTYFSVYPAGVYGSGRCVAGSADSRTDYNGGGADLSLS